MLNSISLGFANHVDENGKYEFEGWGPIDVDKLRRENEAREAKKKKEREEQEAHLKMMPSMKIEDRDADS